MQFTEAIRTTSDLLTRMESGGVSEAQACEEVVDLIASVDGARGFFVSLLTGDSTLADRPPSWLFDAFRKQEETVAELLVKNLLMSTATAVTHRRQGDDELAGGSERVARRTVVLIELFASERLRSLAQEMIAAIELHNGSATPATGDRYRDFLKRWSYDRQQLEAAREAIEAVL